MTSSLEALADRLRKAAEAVDAAEIAADLRPAAFQYVLGELSDGSSTLGASSPSGNLRGRAASDGTGAVQKIAARLGLSGDVVSRVFEEEDGDLRLILKRSMLPNVGSKAASMRDIALLTVTGRQAAEVEDTTSYDTIRRECQELRVYDQPNFATELAKLEFRTTGSARARHAKAHRHHFDEAADLVRTIAQRGDQ